jgi:thiol-disulfide isomerase/thioredoxin
MEGQPAPPLDLTRGLDRRLSALESFKGKVVILFFWAHSSDDCRAQAPILATLLDRYHSAGLRIVAPTQLSGYAANHASATPEAEVRYIIQTRNLYYPFLRGETVPLGAANYKRYGVSTTPTLVIFDRGGVIQHYHAGRMTIEKLQDVVIPLF